MSRFMRRWSGRIAAAAPLILIGMASCEPGQYTAGGLCVAEAKVICQFKFQCCNASERQDLVGMHLDMPYDDEASCLEMATRSLCTRAATTAESVTAGRAAWDAAKAEACYGPLFEAVDACDAATVITFEPHAVACGQIVTGRVADGAACFEDYECATDGARCVIARHEEITSQGRCTPPPGEGEGCDDAFCATGLYCHYTASPTCRRLKAEGQACDSSMECASDNCVPDTTDYRVRTCGPAMHAPSCDTDADCTYGTCLLPVGACVEPSEPPSTYAICAGNRG